MLDKFSWGMNIDNVWTYSGMPPPKSAVVPFLVSLRLSRGPIDVFEHPSARQAIEEHLKLPDGSEAPSLVKEVCEDLVIRLKEAKISLVRAWFPWNYFKRNVLDEEPLSFALDTFVQTLKSNGIGIIGVLANGYSRFLPQGASVEHLQEYLKPLVVSWQQIVRHYGGSIDTWQIENEPNWWEGHIAVNWRSGLIWLEHGSVEAILHALYDIVRQECPKGKILVNCEADRHNVDWELYAKYCDILGLDFYPAYAHPHKTTAEEIGIVSKDVKKKVGKQLIVAETGQPSGPHLLGYSEEHQAEFIRSACEEAYTSDAIDAFCVWRFSDSYWKSFPMQENHFGLLTREREPKPAWFEYLNQIKGKT
jgi:hypothetical protein